MAPDLHDKKKKKKKRQSESVLDENLDSSIEIIDNSEAHGKQKKKKHKHKGNNETIIEVEDSIHIGEVLVKKKKGEIEKESEQIVDPKEHNVAHIQKKKKKKCKKHKEEKELVVQENEISSSNVVEECEDDVSHVSKNKKKNKSKDEIESVEVAEKKSKKKKRKYKDLEADSDDPIYEEKEVQKKKKKRKYKDVEADSDNPICEEKEVQKKKKKKKYKDVEADSDDPICEEEEVPIKKNKKKRKSKSDDWKDEVNRKNMEEHVEKFEQESSNKTGKKKKDKDSDKSVSLSESDHKDEKGSQVTKDYRNVAPPCGQFGQWGTAQFENEDRQQKFFRLLGGFKKSTPDGVSGKKKSMFGSLGTKVGGSFAMSGNKQSELCGKLENQFEQARDFAFNKSRGIGLGYEPPPGEGKKFHIEVSKSKSMKFGD